MLQLLGGRLVGLVVLGLVLEEGEVGETADADHEPLVEVGAKDGHEFQALEEGDGLVARLVEHAVIEAQPADLTVLAVGEVIGLGVAVALLGDIIAALFGALVGFTRLCPAGCRSFCRTSTLLSA